MYYLMSFVQVDDRESIKYKWEKKTNLLISKNGPKHILRGDVGSVYFIQSAFISKN